MPRVRDHRSLAAALLTCILFAHSDAIAGSFFQPWSKAGWTFEGVAGNTDGDPQDELLFRRNSDQHFALIDGLTGATDLDLPDFKYGEAGTRFENVDADPQLEVLCFRPGGGPVTPLTRLYDWNAGSYSTLVNHSDPVSQIEFAQMRSGTEFELIEVSPADVVVRAVNGTVLLRASTAVSPWSGRGTHGFALELDGDGVPELAVIQRLYESDQQTLYFRWTGASFAYQWSMTSWNVLGVVNTDSDVSSEVFAFNLIDGRFELFNGTTGSVDMNLSNEFTMNNGSTIHFQDINGDGRAEIFATRPEMVASRLFRAYQWISGSFYDELFSHVKDGVRGPVQTRSTTQYEYLEVPGIPIQDVVLRDMAGDEVFRASIHLLGWTPSSAQVSPIDLDGDGVMELLIENSNSARVVRFNGSSHAQLWSTSTWRGLSPIPGVGSAPIEGFVAHAGDGHFGMLSPLSGGLLADWPAFNTSNSGFGWFDLDHNGRNELLFMQLPGPSLTTSYRWNNSAYVEQFSHNDPVDQGYLVAPYRTTAQSELLEVLTTDLRIRTSSGAVIFRASTDLPAWANGAVTASNTDVDHDGISEFVVSDPFVSRFVRYMPTTGVGDGAGGVALGRVTSTPNPFRGATRLQFSTRAEGDVGIAVYDLGGRLLRKLDRRLPAGSHDIEWDGRDASGRAAPGGVLFFEVQADGARETRKLVRIGE